jgi:radical SAM protein with 4Fe4S-binding SPASM domain
MASKMKKCSRCEYARYCGKQCARDHWKEHKKTCGKD